MNSVMSRLAKFSNRLIPIRDRVAPSDRSTQVPPIGVPLRPLNMAEIERGVPRGQCLDRRIVTPIKSLPRGSFWANAVFFASVRGIMRRGIFAFPAAQRHAAGGGTLREIPQAASSRPDTATVIARFGAFLALLGNRKRETHFQPTIRHHPTSQCGFWAVRQFSPEKKFSPKLSFGAAESIRKSAKRRRSGLS
jgi:hypothetical protein